MDLHREKYAGNELLKRFKNAEDENARLKILNELSGSSVEIKKFTGKSLLAVGLDINEAVANRNYALLCLAPLIKTFCLLNDEEVERQLINMIDGELHEIETKSYDTYSQSSKESLKIIQSALFVLLTVNKSSACHTIDSLISKYGMEGAWREISQMRSRYGSDDGKH